MHYYQFHITDFAYHTSHLSLEEDAVYRRLLDFYYDREAPIPKETQSVIRRLRLVNCEDVLARILEEFFVLTDEGWRNYRADAEILAYHAKAEVARENGKKGGRPKKNNDLGVKITQPVNLANPDITQMKANEEPLTINQEPITTLQQSKIVACPTSQIIELYKETVSRLPYPRVVPDVVKQNISARWREDDRFKSLDFWKELFQYVDDNKFLSGQVDGRDGRAPFRATLQWIVKAANFAKIVNEDYSK